MPAFRTFKRGAFNPFLVGKLCTTFGTDTVSTRTEGTTLVAALATALTSALTTTLTTTLAATLTAATACSFTFAYIETFSSCFHFSWIYHCFNIHLKKQAMPGTACFKTHHHPSPNLERRSSNAVN
jgi:hypothetical protein